MEHRSDVVIFKHIYTRRIDNINHVLNCCVKINFNILLSLLL